MTKIFLKGGPLKSGSRQVVVFVGLGTAEHPTSSAVATRSRNVQRERIGKLFSLRYSWILPGRPAADTMMDRSWPHESIAAEPGAYLSAEYVFRQPGEHEQGAGDLQRRKPFAEEDGAARQPRHGDQQCERRDERRPIAV